MFCFRTRLRLGLRPTDAKLEKTSLSTGASYSPQTNLPASSRPVILCNKIASVLMSLDIRYTCYKSVLYAPVLSLQGLPNIIDRFTSDFDALFTLHLHSAYFISFSVLRTTITHFGVGTASQYCLVDIIVFDYASISNPINRLSNRE